MMIGTVSFDLKKHSKKVLLLPYLLITLIFLVVPLVLVLLSSFINVNDGVNNQSISISNNWNFIDSFIIEKIFLSILLSLISTFFVLIIGYVFAYFLSMAKSMFWKTIIIGLITSPMWISFLIKVVGLKTFFDFVNQEPNSTFGHIFTIIGYVYLNLPIFILTIISAINAIPKNILNASKDLGKNSVQTFFYIIIPNTKSAIIAGFSLVFFPTVTTAGVSQFLNNSNDGSSIGNSLLQQGLAASTSQIALSRTSTLALLLAFIVLAMWSLLYLVPKAVKLYKTHKMKGETNNALV